MCNIFGSFIRLHVTEDRDDGECWVIEHSRDSNGIHNFPPSVTEKTRKDMLYNAIVQFCIRNNYSWEDPATYGKPFIIDLCNTLWYIDGHSVADPGGFPRFLETSQNLQHMGWVWSIIMVVVNYYRRNRHTHKHFSNQAPRKDEIIKHSEQ